ncbi:MAG: S8 family serine peptidase [Acidimicrobiia bacterium]|nr:S8 family serine peptidase [Acidimicrobiia bacterium]
MARRRLLGVVVTASLLVSFVVVSAPALSASGGEDLHVSLDSAPADLTTGRRNTPSPAERFTANTGSMRAAELLVDDGPAGAIASAIERLGGSVLGTAPGVMLVRVPEGSHFELSQIPGVVLVRDPRPSEMVPAATGETAEPASEVATLTRADVWHAAGFTGSGVSIGVIDYFDQSTWDASVAGGQLKAPAATFCRSYGSDCNIWAEGSRHGVASSELIYDMAPNADLYLATVSSVTDLAAAVAWFDSKGVSIISRSLVAFLDGPGDGTGPYDSIADDAVARGMLWVNAGGNYATSPGLSDGGYWRGTAVDADSDGWIEFVPGDEALDFTCGSIQGIRWSDWGPNPTDYDVTITDAITGDTVATSNEDQGAGAPPIEIPPPMDCRSHPNLKLWITIFDKGNGIAGDVIEFMANQANLEYSSNPYSVTHPIADSANPGVLAVAAVDPAAGQAIAGYSSQGPTNDGRTKPDIAAPSCLEVLAYPFCFNGTSAAAPVVSGAAALLLEAGLASTPQALAAQLKTMTTDLGTPGADNIYGAGKLLLGNPPGVFVGSFIDDDDSIFQTEIEWLKTQGITLGCNPPLNNRFCPKQTLTRAQLAAFLSRALNLQGQLDNPFTDDDGSIFEDDIEKLAFAGITLGCNPPANDHFCPNKILRRDQMAAFLGRAFGYVDVGAGNLFVDDDGSVFEMDIDRLATAGVTNGCSPGHYCPSNNVTREQFAAFLFRAFT